MSRQKIQPMSEEQRAFLSVCHRIERYTFEQVGWRLNASPEEVAAWVKARILPVLGSPSRNSRKFVARKIVDELAIDERKLAKATDISLKYWRQRNGRAEKAEHGNGRGGELVEDISRT